MVPKPKREADEKQQEYTAKHVHHLFINVVMADGEGQCNCGGIMTINK